MKIIALSGDDSKSGAETPWVDTEYSVHDFESLYRARQPELAPLQYFVRHIKVCANCLDVVKIFEGFH